MDARSTDEEVYLNIYMIGFNCKGSIPAIKHGHDLRTKNTILYIIGEFLRKNPDETFVYVCQNSDGLARNRYITFGRWFKETNDSYELHKTHLRYYDDDWYSASLIKRDNQKKQIFINAYHYTLQQMMNNENEGE